ncbi:hypothetical protein FIV42_20160 [Persicimonas caeni]|uniref:Uncharacterized protein n=1 Tax=Persicimonas caeni TaxID=2292766 RepID=A0A4Y6PXB3_PERCE|nr:hypothetical protein [Persicimonas caeni]QDG52974.1 hypothetical protein FIV42_20160 [Persicimonas caeni]QED34196.1 hypothetical protein FRD00_20155 [Persicimonas caeni]
MTDKPKFPPPLPRKDREADDEDETLLDMKVDLPPEGEWDDAEPTMVGESLKLPPRGDVGADDETLMGHSVDLPPADEWDDAEPTMVHEPLERPDAADTAPRQAPRQAPRARHGEGLVIGDVDADQGETAPRDALYADQGDTQPRDALYAGAPDEDELDETAPHRIRDDALPGHRPEPRPQQAQPQQAQPQQAQPQQAPQPRAPSPQVAQAARVSAQQEQAEQPEEPEERSPADFKDALPLFIVSGALSMLVMLTIAVRQWLAPWLPFAAALGIAAALSGSISYLYCNRDRQEALAKGFGVCAAFALPTLLWMVTPVRAALVDNFGPSLPTVAQQKALVDPAREVQLTACVQAGVGGDAFMETQLIELFTTQPQVGTECVARLAERAPARAQELSHRFLRHWSVAFRNQDNALVCGAAPHLMALKHSETQRPAQHLTYCATTATDPATAQCCADAITDRFDSAQEYAVALGDSLNIPAQRRLSLFSAMVAYAFAGVDASRNSLPTLERRLLRKKPVRDWILGLGCQTLFSESGSGDVLLGLEAVVESHSCPSGQDIERERKSWVRICSDMIDQQRSSDQLCDSVHRETVAGAVRTATAEVHAALDAMFADETTPGIKRAHAKFNRIGNSVDSKGAFMAEGISPLGNRQVGDGRTRHMARQIGGNYNREVRRMKEEAARIEGKNRPDYDESVQKLLQRDVYKPQASWEDAKRQMNSQDRNKLQQQLDKAKKKLDR